MMRARNVGERLATRVSPAYVVFFRAGPGGERLRIAPARRFDDLLPPGFSRWRGLRAQARCGQDAPQAFEEVLQLGRLGEREDANLLTVGALLADLQLVAIGAEDEGCFVGVNDNLVTLLNAAAHVAKDRSLLADEAL